LSISASCVQALEGRLRLKIPEVKGAPFRARELVHNLAQSPGVDEVAANSITGSVLILYNPRLIGPEEVVLAIQEIGCLQGPQPRPDGGEKITGEKS
jgi:hypothetical protein